MKHSFIKNDSKIEYGNFVFRIYNAEHSYVNRDDDIIFTKESLVDRNDLYVDEYINTPDEIISMFNENMEIYQGATYCIKDLDVDGVIVGGVYNPADIKILKDYFKIA